MATSDELTQAKIDAAEARTDTKIARLEGKLDLLIEGVRASREEAGNSRRAIIANIWAVIGVVVVVLGLFFTVAPVVFDFGFKLRETITKEVQEQIRTSPGK